VSAFGSQQPPLQSESTEQVDGVGVLSVPPPLLLLTEPPPELEPLPLPPPLLVLPVEASCLTLGVVVALSKGLEFVLEEPHATSVRAPM